MSDSGSSGGAGCRRVWRIGLLLALIIIIVAAVILWVTQPAPGRDPVEFLPASTQAAMDFDMRPGSPGLRQALREWGTSDVRHLGQRATELAQELVNWSGLDLEVRKEVLPWFGGELLLASVAGPTDRARPLRPESFVLILRAKSMRRARASLEKGVKPFAREAHWRRRVETRADEKVTVWYDTSWRPQLGYLAKDGCLLVSQSPETIERCLMAAQRAAQRLSYSERFDESVGRLPRETMAWAYIDARSLLEGARVALPGLREGWPGALRAYRRSRHGGTTPDSEAAGAVAFSVAAVREGAQLRLVYRGPQSEEPKTTLSTLRRVTRFVPREAVFYAAVHKPGAWLRRLLDTPGEQESPEPARRRWMSPLRRRYLFFPPSPQTWLGLDQVPSDLMIAVLPADDRPGLRLAVAAPEGELPVPPRGLLSMLFRKPASAVIDKTAILATDVRSLAQCSRAAKARPPLLDLKGDVQFVISARLSRPFAQVGHVTELKAIGRRAPGGSEGEIRITAPPRYLLGGK